ncbi:hypothetical protein ACTXT7_009140 [Hymenolepis weldensis]
MEEMPMGKLGCVIGIIFVPECWCSKKVNPKINKICVGDASGISHHTPSPHPKRFQLEPTFNFQDQKLSARGISRELEHSGKCGRATDRVSNKRGVPPEAVSVN